MGAFNPHVDFTAERSKVDWLDQQRLGAVLQRLALRLLVAIGGDHDDGDVRSQCFGLGQEFKAAHPRHIDVGQNQNERPVASIGDALKSHVSRLNKFHCEAASAEVAPELLAEQNFDISLIVNHENKQAHARPPDLAADRELTKPINCIVGRLRAMNSKDAAAPPRGLNDPVTGRTP